MSSNTTMVPRCNCHDEYLFIFYHQHTQTQFISYAIEAKAIGVEDTKDFCLH